MATSSRSWQVSSSALRTPALALGLLVALLGLAEGVARSPSARSALHAPSLGSPSRRFEMQFDSLERYASTDSGIDCIILGNSTALMGVDPEVLGSAHRERSGSDLRCFNFGVSGMTASAAGAVAPILLARYRPSLLVYVVTARDVGENVDGPMLADVPWVRYQRGRFSLNGWLVEHSAAFRYFLLYRQWLEPSRWPAATSSSGTTAEGYFPLESSLALSPALWAHTERILAGVADQPPSTAELNGLSDVLRLSGNGTRVIVVEAPVHEKVQHWVRRDGGFYAAAMAHIRGATRRQGVPFWRVPTWRVIPADGWADFVHLNRRGATQFSQWLGARIADAERDGRLGEPRPRPTRA